MATASTPRAKGFTFPGIRPANSPEELKTWSDRFNRLVQDSFREIQNFFMPYTGKGRVSKLSVAAGFTINSDGLFVFLTSASDVTSDTTNAIASGKDAGEQLILVNMGSHIITIKNLANTKLGGGDVPLNPNNSLWILWDGTDWIRLGVNLFT